MSNPFQFDNVVNAEDVGMTLASPGISSSGSTGTINVVSAVPATNLSYPFLLTIASQNETQNSSVELFRIDSGSIGGNTFHFSDRALNGTTAQAWNAGDFAEVRNNALIPLELQDVLNSNSGALSAGNVYSALNL